jgi:hypothetical protein
VRECGASASAREWRSARRCAVEGVLERRLSREGELPRIDDSDDEDDNTGEAAEPAADAEENEDAVAEEEDAAAEDRARGKRTPVWERTQAYWRCCRRNSSRRRAWVRRL